MDGAVHIFAGEFNRSTLPLRKGDPAGDPGVVTPSGASCGQVILSGVLMEVHEENDMLYARMADPTGGFDLVCSSRNPGVSEILRAAPRPSFIEITGRVRVSRNTPAVTLAVRPDMVRQVDRKARDRWILKTARETIRRLSLVRDFIASPSGNDDCIAAAARHYRPSAADLDALAAMTEVAVDGIAPPETGSDAQPDPRLLIIDILKASPGPRGVPVEEIIETLGQKGVFQDIVLKSIEALIVEDECYQPQKGFIRLL